MSGKPLTLATPPAFQCYDCLGCGACCRGRFAIIVTRADRARLEEQGWTADELGLGSRPLFSPSGDGFLLAHHDDGACVFLDARGLCRIHARFGEPAKPLACRLYPFRFVPLGSQLRVDVRFDCPATAGNRGRPIPGHRAALLGLLREMAPAVAPQAPPLCARVPATWAQLCRITETFESLLVDEALPLTRRVLGMANLAALLASPRVVELEGRKLSAFLETVARKVRDAAASAPARRTTPPGQVLFSFRQLAGLYGRLDRVGEAPRLLARLRDALRMLGGRGQVPPLRADFPRVTFAAIDRLTGTPANGAAAALERYLHLRLASMGFFGAAYYGRSYLDGMNALLLTYPLACWFARAYALGRGLDAPDAAALETALQIIDHQHGITPLLDLPSERYRARFLGDRAHLAALVRWYGE